jgi:hypothetical protein
LASIVQYVPTNSSLFLLCVSLFFADGMSKGSSDNSTLQSILQLQCTVDNETAKGPQVFNFSHVGEIIKKWPMKPN